MGEAGVLRELKMANDNLRWRLQQRNKVLEANRALISSLQSALRDSQAEVGRLRPQSSSVSL